MNVNIQHLIGIIIITVTNIYIWCKLYKKKIKFDNIKIYIIFLLMAILTLANYFYNNEFIRIVTITIVMSFFIKIIFKDSFKKSFLCSVFSQIIYMLSEIVFTIIFVYILNITPQTISKLYFGNLLGNTAISIIVIIFSNLKPTQIFSQFLVKITEKIKYNYLIMMLLIVMIAINIFFMTPYYHLDFNYIMIFNIILTFICFSITIYSFYNKDKYMKTYDKYNTTLNSLKEYENILDKYRILNHENKNQLMTVRNMLSKNDIRTKNYIDAIIKNKLKDNEKIMTETAKIPEGGLRGIIYSKILQMKNLNIPYSLIIDKNVRTTTLINNLDDSTMLDICQIIGVYLDNAIQEVTNLEQKFISIEIYIIDNKLQISISNNFKDSIQIDNLEKAGYTTKGKNHGYGLSLTKQIIQNNKKLTNAKEINKNIFSQILKIKI